MPSGVPGLPLCHLTHHLFHPARHQAGAVRPVRAVFHPLLRCQSPTGLSPGTAHPAIHQSAPQMIKTNVIANQRRSAGVAIRILKNATGKRIATPVCALARNDIYFRSPQREGETKLNSVFRKKKSAFFQYPAENPGNNPGILPAEWKNPPKTNTGGN